MRMAIAYLKHYSAKNHDLVEQETDFSIGKFIALLQIDFRQGSYKRMTRFPHRVSHPISIDFPSSVVV